jgi:hypothetical protein
MKGNSHQRDENPLSASVPFASASGFYLLLTADR